MRYGHRDQLSWLCFDGAVRYTESRELKSFLDQVVLPEMGDTMVIDLREVLAIDSTGLGLLASIGRQHLERFGGPAIILCPEGEMAQYLRAMRFDKLFTLTESLELPVELPLAPVVRPPSPREPLAHVMLDAHKALSDVDEQNRRRFNDVVEQLKHSVEKGQH